MEALKKILKNSHLMVIICVVLMLVSMFLPSISAGGDYLEFLKEDMSLIEIPAEKLINVSFLNT